MRLLYLPLCVALASALPDGDTLEIAEAYRTEVLMKRDLAEGLDLCAENVRWIDPTAAKWGLPLTTGIEGRETMRSTMEGFGLLSAEFEVSLKFAAGPYACLFGEFASTKSSGSGNPFPFMTVLRVEEGLIVERIDYGDYDAFFPEAQRTGEGEFDPLPLVAREYVSAYADADIETLRAFLADEAEFQDPTAVVVGAGERYSGADEVADGFEKAFANVKSFEFEPATEFFFNDHAVFAGTSSYAFPGAVMGLPQEEVRFEHGLIIVLQIQDEKVVRHTDYSDYDTFLAQVKSLRDEAVD